MISDTLFVFEDGTQEGLNKLINFSRSLLERSLENYFPIRGAITCGNVAWGDLIYGSAVIEAHLLEKSQDWIGITCASGLDVTWSWDSVCCYPVPKKKGPYKVYPAVIWSIPNGKEFITRCCGKGLMRDQEILHWEQYSKFSNTQKFSLYVNKSKHLDLNPSIFNSSVLDVKISI